MSSGYYARVLVVLTLACPSLGADQDAGTKPVTHVQNFTLPDYAGKEWALYDLKDANAIVIYVHGVGCPIVRLSVPEIEQLRADFEPKEIRFLMLNANQYDTAEDLKADAEDFHITIPILMDRDQLVARQLGVERTATTYVIDPKNDWQVIYRGAVSNRQGYGQQRQHSIKHWLKDALTEHLAGHPITNTSTIAKGCLINYLDVDAPEGTE